MNTQKICFSKRIAFLAVFALVVIVSVFSLSFLTRNASVTTQTRADVGDCYEYTTSGLVANPVKKYKCETLINKTTGKLKCDYKKEKLLLESGKTLNRYLCSEKQVLATEIINVDNLKECPVDGTACLMEGVKNNMEGSFTRCIKYSLSGNKPWRCCLSKNLGVEGGINEYCRQ